jgi:hypothetical protein
MSDVATAMADAIDRAGGEAQRRALARQRSEAYRDRRPRGAMLVTIELRPNDLAALERLALLAPGDRGPQRMASAAAQFLAAAPHVAAMGDALWPDRGCYCQAVGVAALSGAARCTECDGSPPALPGVGVAGITTPLGVPAPGANAKGAPVRAAPSRQVTSFSSA